MTSRISHTTIDAHDAYRQSVWWAEVLGMHRGPRGSQRARPRGVHDLLPRRPDPRPVHRGARAKQVKNRIHFDLRPTAGPRDDEVERLAKLGATVVADRRRPDGGWVTMADPEGNEFCVLRGEAEVTDPYAHLVSR